MATILTINSIPETFDSELPMGVVGNVAHLDLITPDNVVEITVGEYGDYEENIDGEFTVELKNGDTIRVDGYNGMWEILHMDKLKESARIELINDFREWAKEQAANVAE